MKAAQRVLQTSDRQWDDKMTQQAKQCMNWFTSNLTDDDYNGKSTFPQTWELVQRLLVDQNLRLETPLLNAVLNQWRHERRRDQSTVTPTPEEMLSFLNKFSSKGNLKPTETSYNLILHAQQNPEKAEHLLEKMIVQDDLPEPTIVTFCTVLHLFVSNGLPLHRVQALEQRRKELARKGYKPKLIPNAIYKTAFLNAYAQAKKPHDCQTLWKEWRRDCQRNKRLEPPGLAAATTVLTAWSRAGDPKHAELMLREMIELHGQGRKDDFLEEPPNIVSYTAVIDAWAKARQPERAEAILRELKVHDKLKPNVITYTTVIGAWSKQGNLSKAEFLLREMIEEGIAPNTNTFNAVLLSSTSPKQSLSILQSMRRLAQLHKWDCRPDVVSYTTILHHCAKCGDTIAANEVWQDMTDNDVFPDIVAYNSLLNAHSKAGMPEEAQSLLERMVDQYDGSSQTYPQPQVVSFNTVLSAWAKNGDVERAEKLFEWMQKTTKPNVISYTNLLNCWAKISSKAADEEKVIPRVEALIEEMEKDSATSPGIVSYGALCKCYARFGMGPKAVAVLRGLSSKKLSPNQTLYTQVIRALAENCVKAPEKSWPLMNQIEALMDEMEELGIKPTVIAYSACLKAISASTIPDKRDRVKDILGRMEATGVQPNDVIGRQVTRILG